MVSASATLETISVIFETFESNAVNLTCSTSSFLDFFLILVIKFLTELGYL